MYQSYRDGWIETISGCMFAGKTEELIRRIKVLEFAKKEIMVFKPKIDNRYSETKVVSHAGSSVESHVISDAVEILEMIKPTTQVVAIDEAQFFDNNICAVCNELADRGIRVMAAVDKQQTACRKCLIRQRIQFFHVGTHHPQIDVIIPGNKAPLPYRSQ